MATKVRKTNRRVANELKRTMIFDLIKHGFSYSRVGDMLGMTKNAISGFVFRDKHKKPPKEKKLNPHKARVRKVKNVITFVMPEIGEGVTIFELKNDSCRAMIGNHKYCGNKSHSRSYCLTHYTEYYQHNQRKAK
jgi:hypothetical protein